MAYLPATRAETRLLHTPSLAALISALLRRLARPRRRSPEEHLAAQARREAARREVDRLL